MLKSELRQAALQARAATPLHLRQQFQTAALAALPRILSLSPVPQPVVAGFWPVRDEPDPRPLLIALQARGVTTCLPCVEAGTRILTFRQWQQDDPMRQARFGIPEPLTDAPICQPDVMLVPCAGVDAKGHRIGYGGGYYDATLQDLRARRPFYTIALTYELFEFSNYKPELHDEVMDSLLSAQGFMPVPQG